MDKQRLAAARLAILRVFANTRNPALLMNLSSYRSNTTSLMEGERAGASCRSNSGAVTESRLPMSLIAMARGFRSLHALLNLDFERHIPLLCVAGFRCCYSVKTLRLCRGRSSTTQTRQSERIVTAVRIF
jgi:hypothetical protein